VADNDFTQAALEASQNFTAPGSADPSQSFLTRDQLMLEGMPPEAFATPREAELAGQSINGTPLTEFAQQGVEGMNALAAQKAAAMNAAGLPAETVLPADPRSRLIDQKQVDYQRLPSVVNPEPEGQPIDVAPQQAPQTGLSQQVLKPAMDAFEAEKRANNQLAAAANSFIKEKEAATQFLAEQNAQQVERREADINARVEARKKIDADAQALLARKVDPENFWNSKGTGPRLLGALSIALGEISKGMSGNLSGPNAALNIINDAIVRDTKAQQENYERDKTKLNAAYSALSEEYKDKDLLEQLYKDNLTQQYQLKINELAGKYEGTKTGLELRKLNAQIDQQRQAQQQKNMQEAVMLGLINGDKPVGGEDPLNLSPSALASIEAAKPELKNRYVSGFGFATANPEEVKKFKDEIIDAKGVVETTNALKDITKSLTLAGRLNPYNVDKARAKTLSQELIGKLRLSFLGPGAITDQEREALLSVIGERGEFNIFETDKTRLAKITEIAKSVENRTINRIKSLGLDPSRMQQGAQQKIDAFKQSVSGLKPSK
jgi:hypothetical protein